MTDLPSNVGYGTVVGKFLVALPDSADAGFNPDAVPATGTVTFTPAPLRLLDAGAVPPVTILPTPTICTLNTSGVLAATEGGTGVTLLATNDPDLSPVGWTYTVTVAITGHPVYEFDMALPVGTTVDLATVTPVDPSGGVAVPVTGELAPVIVRAGAWHLSPYTEGIPVGTAWPIADRLYLTPFFAPESIDVTQVAIHVTSAGAGGSVIRLAVFESDPATGLPADVLSQSTVTNASTGIKTLTLGTPVTVEGLWWVASGPQSAGGGVGQAYMSGGTAYRALPMFAEASAPLSSNNVSFHVGYVSAAGAVGDAPSTTWESASRQPAIAVKYA